MNKILKLIISFIAPFTAGAIGSLVTFPNITTWYAILNKPSFNPPNWIFGPVWTLLYILMGISIYLVWTTPPKQRKKNAFIVFGIQLLLNLLWSIVFFGLHSIVGGFIIILGLLVAIGMTIRCFWPLSRQAAYLLTPYLMWVCFATVLNGAIMLLN